MREFKFFKRNTLPEVDLEIITRRVEMIERSCEHIPAGYIVPYQRSEENIPYEEYEGWAAHYNNLPPGQCPYDIGTQERSSWLDGWCKRSDYLMEDGESQPEDELYVGLEDVDTGENFGIPAEMSYAISYRGRMLYDNSRTVSGSHEYGEYVYWIDNVYSTINHTLVIEVTISVPNTVGRGVTFHKIRQIVPYETI